MCRDGWQDEGMTLSTYIRVIDPVAARPVFDFGRDLLGCTDANAWETRDDWCGTKALMNTIGQGLPSMLIVQYGHDGPLPADEDEDYEGFVPAPLASLSVNFDTAYGYRGPNGSGCSDLHAWLVREYGRWLNGKGLRWAWCNEFTGDWLEGFDGLEGFGDAERGALRESVAV